MKEMEWADLLHAAAGSAVVEAAAPGTTLQDEFDEHLRDFLTNRQRGERIEDIFSGRPWEDQEGGKHFFRLRDLDQHLKFQSARLRNLSRKELARHIRRLGGKETERKIKGVTQSLFWVPSGAIDGPTPSVAPPPIPQDPI